MIGRMFPKSLGIVLSPIKLATLLLQFLSFSRAHILIRNAASSYKEEEFSTGGDLRVRRIVVPKKSIQRRGEKNAEDPQKRSPLWFVGGRRREYFWTTVNYDGAGLSGDVSRISNHFRAKLIESGARFCVASRNGNKNASRRA